MYVPRAAPAGVGEETAHRVGHGKAGFLPAGRFLGAHKRCRGLGDEPAAAETSEYVIVAKIANATIILQPNDSAGIIMSTLCSAPMISIINHAIVAHIMIGIPTMMNSTKSFPFMVANLLSLLDGFSLLIL